MDILTIHNLDDALEARLRLRAARHGQSMEEEALSILRGALATESRALALLTGAALISAIRANVALLGGVELELPPRKPMREPPDFNGPAFDP